MGENDTLEMVGQARKNSKGVIIRGSAIGVLGRRVRFQAQTTHSISGRGASEASGIQPFVVRAS